MNCSKCGKAVGCGCNLKGGLCATCNQQKTQPQPKIEDPLDVAKNANKNKLS